VAPAHRNARLNFVLGMLLETDGREREAADAFVRVMNEPDDPAEIQLRATLQSRFSARGPYSSLLQSYSGREEGIPGVFAGLQVPSSLMEAKMEVKSRLARLAMEQGGDIWTHAATVIPELAVATPGQWREAMEFARTGQNGSGTIWWGFVESHPANPLGVELLIETGQDGSGKPEQVDALLKTRLSPRIQLALRLGIGIWRADNLEFLESIQAADWQDEANSGHCSVR
jgi:hypothetical protein